jgi:hypothetical protein
LFYANDMAGVNELRQALPGAVESALGDPDIDNPVHRALQRRLLREVANPG